MKNNYSQAIVVEGRDDVDAVSKAVDALIIPTHGFGITAETWALIEKAHREKGLIILTDPDYSGEEIRKKINKRFPDSINAYIAQEDAIKDGDIGIENAIPEVIEKALMKAVSNRDRQIEQKDFIDVQMSDLIRLNLAGGSGSHERRAELCSFLGIGYGNSRAVLRKLKHWKIGIEELEQAVQKIEK